jgi:apolipoprotein N-acyltransferase
VLLEFGRTNLPIIGFPWNLAGYSISGHLALVQLTAWTGIYGLSFLVVAFNALVAWTVSSQKIYARWITGVLAAILILVIAAGRYFVPKAPAQHVAHLVHTQFPQYMSFPPDWMHIHAADMKELEDRSVAASRAAPGLLVWPEVPAPFSLQDPEFAAIAERIAQESGGDFLVGVDDWKLGPKGRWSVSNSAVLLDPSGRRIFTYDKIHLVPFGEYVPLRRWLFFAKKLTAEIGDFQPGSTYSVGKLPGGRFGVFICYEAVFGSEVRRFTANGAELLINVSNDGWFGHSGAPQQHFNMARVRAVENRRWLLRATNTGYTGAVDPYGRVVAEFSADTLGVLDVPYDFRSNLTFYTRHGDWLCWLSLLVVATALWWRR